MFEPPEVYDDFLCLSAGVYEYFKTKNGKRIIFQKTRGMAKGSSDENTDMVETDDESKSLRFALRQAIAEGKDYLEIEQKLVYSPGAMGVSGRPEYLGLIIDAVKKLKINAHTLYPKRFALPFTLQEVHDGLIETDAMEIDRFPEVKHGDQWSIPDGTLPLLREAFLKQTWGFMETEEYKEYRKSLKAPKGKDKEKIKGHQATYNTKRHGEQAEYLNYLKSKYGEDLKTLNSTFPLPGRSKWGARYLRSFIHPVTGEKGKAALEQFMQEEGYTS
jgi:hypothetical protein